MEIGSSSTATKVLSPVPSTAPEIWTWGGVTAEKGEQMAGTYRVTLLCELQIKLRKLAESFCNKAEKRPSMVHGGEPSEHLLNAFALLQRIAQHEQYPVSTNGSDTDLFKWA